MTRSFPSTGTAPAPQPWLSEFVLLAAIWGSSFLFMHIAAMEFGALPTAAVRVAIASAFLMPLLLYRGLGRELLQHWKPVFFVGLLNSGVPFALLSFALLTLTTGLSSILNATVPLFGALVAWLWLRDKPDSLRVLGLLVGFGGVAMLAWDKTSLQPAASGIASGWAVLACLVACLCYGISASFTRRYISHLKPLVTAAGSQVGATLGLAPAAWWLWPDRTPGAPAWLALLAVGVLCTGVAYILFFRLIANVGPARALSVTFVVPVFALVYGFVFLNEAITPWMLVCAAAIVCGTALSTGLVTWRTLTLRG
ncbi:MAG: DMT family transporter [Pseudomonadota bacterium]